jgi:large subunit ribosomal protein L1
MPTNKSKRLKKALALIKEDQYTLNEALKLLEKYRKEASARFDESVEIVLKLAVDTKKSDQMVRGAVAMPHGLGKKFKIAVLTNSANFETAKKAGAALVGDEELIEKIKSGQQSIDFDICIATPDIMPKMATIGKLLGPKGLMPNPKSGTVAADVKTAVERASSGQVEYRVNSDGLVHAGVGKLSLTTDALMDNIKALCDALISAKPTSVKGNFLQKFYVSTSQGPSIHVAVTSI